MATGVLVVMVGQATKLAPFLTADNKRYRATIMLGVATDTLDAEGQVLEQAQLPAWWYEDDLAASRIAAALAEEQLRSEQLPPVFSAIKIAGKSAHARVRAGEHVELPPRPVQVHCIDAISRSAEAGTFAIELETSKGYYVRALARDLGTALALPAHLCALRRLASGPFVLQHACAAEDELLSDPQMMLALEQAVALAMPTARLTEAGEARARCGGPMRLSDFETPPPARASSGWLSPSERLVAIGGWRKEQPAVLRGFVDAEPLQS